MDKLRIGTSQNVVIEYEIASVGDRMVAYLLDMLILTGYSIVISIGISIMQSSSEAAVILAILFILPLMFYNLVSELFMNGQTIGKRAMNIKVINIEGKELKFGSYLMRWLFRLIEVIPYGLIAIISIVVNGRGQRLGDMAAGTAVVKVNRNQKLSAGDFTIPSESYVPVFPEAAHLNDQDILLIREALNRKGADNYDFILEKISVKLKNTFQIETKLYYEQFLKTLVRDYNHLNGRL